MDASIEHRASAWNSLTMPQTPAASVPLKEQLKRKLDQARVRTRRRTGDESKVRVIRAATGGVWWSKLGAVEQVKKFHPKLGSCATLGAEDNLLEYGKIKVIHAIRAQA